MSDTTKTSEATKTHCISWMKPTSPTVWEGTGDETGLWYGIRSFRIGLATFYGIAEPENASKIFTESKFPTFGSYPTLSKAKDACEAIERNRLEKRASPAEFAGIDRFEAANADGIPVMPDIKVSERSDETKPAEPASKYTTIEQTEASFPGFKNFIQGESAGAKMIIRFADGRKPKYITDADRFDVAFNTDAVFLYTETEPNPVHAFKWSLIESISRISE